jgi:hypothetical protein
MNGVERGTSLLLYAMDHAISALRDGRSLVPFVVADSGADPELHRFDADDVQASLLGASRYVATECGGTAAVLVYDGLLTMGETASEAIYAETVDERGAVAVVAQRYRPRTRLRRFETIGNPVELAIKGVL